jgi:hypothetical protein
VGAKTWMLVYADGSAREALQRRPALDREATAAFVGTLFPDEKLSPLDDGDLSFTSPPDNEIHAGCFDGVAVVAAREFGGDYPSRLPQRFIGARGGTLTLHAMHSVVDWFAYAQWVDGTLVRSLSLSPDSGVLEDIGAKLPFEEPYWSGRHPAVDGDEPDDAYPFPFHPLDLGEAALAALLGYHLEGPIDPTLLAPETVPLVRYKRSRSRWKFW